jgi:hypothetical protein
VPYCGDRRLEAFGVRDVTGENGASGGPVDDGVRERVPEMLQRSRSTLERLDALTLVRALPPASAAGRAGLMHDVPRGCKK